MLLNDYESNFEKLLHIKHDVCNHHRNIQRLLMEIFKIKKGFAPPIMEVILATLEIFKNLRQKEKELYILV